MKKSLFSILFIAIITVLSSCGSDNIQTNNQDNTITTQTVNLNDGYLLLVETNNGCKYINQAGETIFDTDQYMMCFTDTFRTYAIVLDDNFIAINRSGEKLYDVFNFDNSPDYVVEGLFRIIKDNKIGYADAKTGEIVIEPLFQAAYPFENGVAKVAIVAETVEDGEHFYWESNNWINIDKTGNEIN